MPIFNRQIDAILREYDQIQLANRHALDLRTSEVYSCVPAIADIDSEIASNSVNWVISSFSGSSSDIDTLNNSNNELWAKRQQLLEKAGYPADYLEMKYNCPDCKDTGFIGAERCHCFKKMLIKQLYDASNVKNTLLDENFNTFNFNYYSDDPSKGMNGESPLENIRKVVDKAHHFVDNFDSEFQNLLIYGTTGAGKTFLCNCIAKELMDSIHSVIYQTEYEFFDILEAHKFSNSHDDPSIDERYACIQDCDLLIIDDLGAELTNGLTSSELFRILNERILNRKSTIISTNYTLADLKGTYSDRIFSRIMDKYTLLRLFGEDIRFRKSLSGGQSNGQAAVNN